VQVLFDHSDHFLVVLRRQLHLRTLGVVIMSAEKSCRLGMANLVNFHAAMVCMTLATISDHLGIEAEGGLLLDAH